MSNSIQFVTPLPPLPSGIAQYSRDLLAAAPVDWPLVVFPEPDSNAGNGTSFPIAEWRTFDPQLPTVLQLGNSANHRAAFAAGRRTRGIAVLHDVVLHHALLGEFIRRNDSRTYVAVMSQLYGAEGDRLAREALRGRVQSDLLDWPLSEPYVRRARAVIVHNTFARNQLLARLPEATVTRVPMGVPLPRLTDRRVARKALGLPDSAFIVASITHINPYKRIPVVLRAVRRLAARVPETVLVLAGSVAPGLDIERQIALLGLRPRVRMLGYVDDVDARLVARAADVCVNLRYPVTGETSASLLRLLGAERPVIVTEGVASAELPADVGLRVAADRFEEELLVELLWALATDDDLREESGRVAREFVEAEHTMSAALNGYRAVINDVYGAGLSRPSEDVVFEPFPGAADLELRARRSAPMPVEPVSIVERRLANDLHWLGLGDHAQTLQAAANRVVELGLDRLRRDVGESSTEIDAELLDVLACLVCKGDLKQASDGLICQSCGRRYPIEDGIPNFVLDAQE